MDVKKSLKAIGKDLFVKYYYVFSCMSFEDCMEVIPEEYTETSKRIRISHAKEIFKEGEEYYALEMICKSPNVNPETKSKAEAILYMHFCEKFYFSLLAEKDINKHICAVGLAKEFNSRKGKPTKTSH